MTDSIDENQQVDPNSPAYEAARGRIASYLMRIGSEDPRNSFTEKAEALLRGELYEVPSWIAMDLLARQSLAREPATADVEREDEIRRSIIRQLGDDPHADRIILHGTDWDIVLAALSSAAPSSDHISDARQMVPSSEPAIAEGERDGKWHQMLLALVNAIHRDGGEKTQTIGIDLAYQQALAQSSTPPASKGVGADVELLMDAAGTVSRTGDAETAQRLRQVAELLASRMGAEFVPASPTPSNDTLQGRGEVELRKALAASLAKRSVGIMDRPWTGAFNAALDMVARDTGVSPDKGAPIVEGKCTMDVGCDEAGVCYAAAHGDPSRCPKDTRHDG